MPLRALLASPLGFVVGLVLGVLGGGGSILTVPLLVLLAGETPAAATSTSLVIVGIAAATGAYRHWRAGRVRVMPGLVFGLVGTGGSLAGSALNHRLDGDVLLLAFAGLMLVAAWRIVAGCPSCTRTGEALATGEPDRPASGGVSTLVRSSVRPLPVAAAGTAVGFLTGLFGVGGGFVIVPTLALLLAFSMREAIGTSLLVITVNVVVALAARSGAGTIDWGMAALFAPAAVAGVAVGTRVAGRLDPRVLQRRFAVLLIVLAVYTGGQALAALV